MKRLILLTAALSACFGFTASAASAAETEDVDTDPTLMNITASMTNRVVSLIPGLEGPDTRHICMVFGKLDKSYCLYIPLP